MNKRRPDQMLSPVHRRDRPRAVTGVFFVMCMVVLLGAFASKNNLLYWFVGMAIGAVLVHGFTAGPPMMRLLLAGVELPATVQRGRTAVARVTLASRNRWRTARALRIELDLLGSDGSRLTAHAGLAAIRPGERKTIEIHVHPQRRGVYELEALRVTTVFPFGLSRKQLRFEPGGRLLCVPDAESALGARGRSLERRSLERAADTQPADLREYVPGDATRLIAWRTSARARRLMVRDVETIRNRRVWLRCGGAPEDLAERREDAERMLDRAAAIGREAETMSFQVGVLHERSGTRVLEPGAQRWMIALTELGDRPGVTFGPSPRPEDVVLDLSPVPEPEDGPDG